ncbi:MAG: DNA repair protein RecO [Marinilabiliales bacterium]|nr:MAG: DNA repair protein RecO [Marinilabiliales bacterium]
MDHKTEAIVLNKIKYSDSTYIVNIFTRELGKVPVFIRTSKSKKGGIKPGLLFPLNIIETEVSQKDRRNVQNLKHCDTVFSAFNICSDVYRSSIAQFLAELVSKTLRENETDGDFYDYFKKIIFKLENSDIPPHNLHLLFMKDYARFLGFQITNNFAEESPFFSLREGMFLPVFTTDEESLDRELSNLFSDLLSLDLESIISFSASYKFRKEILKRLIFYYRLHLADFPEIK